MKNMLFILLCCVPLLFTGCIEVTTIINLNRDGSGTIDETVLMGKDVVEMISQFTSSFAEDTSGNVEKFSLFNETEAKEKAVDFGNGVKYLSGKELSLNGKQGYMVTYSFRNIKDVMIDQNPESKISINGESEEGETEREEIYFDFTKGNPAELVIHLPLDTPEEGSQETDTVDAVIPDTVEFAHQDTTMADSTDSASVEQVFKMLEGLKISVILNVNGKIVETNATNVNGSSVTLMNLSFAEILKNEKEMNRLKAINPSNIEELKDILKNIPGIQIEFNNPVKLKFR
jgi:hypothetical protein